MADVPLMNNPMTTAGDVLYGGASGAPTRLAVGTAGQVLKVNAGATAPEWGAGGSDYTAFADYSPTWTNVTVSNGTLVARWARVGTGSGSLVKVQIQLVFGNLTSVSGDIIVSLPATAATRNGNFPLGTGMLVDANGGSYNAIAMYATTTTARIRPILANTTHTNITPASSTVPFTWTTSDVIMAQFEYEAA